MEFESRFWLDLVQWLVMGGLAVLMWARKPGEDASADLKQLRTEMADMRVDYARIHERLSLQESSVLQALKVQERRLERLEDFFMNHFGDSK